MLYVNESGLERNENPLNIQYNSKMRLPVIENLIHLVT